MSIIKIYFIILLSFTITSCSIGPWKTTKFCSCSLENRVKTGSIEINSENSDCIIGNVFFYFVSNGIEDTMYSTKSPYSISLVFESLQYNTIITINSISMEFDGEKVCVENPLPVEVAINQASYPNKESYFGYFETEYAYELQTVRQISVTLNATVTSNGVKITKNLKATAVKEVKKGIVQYRY
ncbi:hypothetical protein [Treponema sp. UBA3813]|uniref:hypothetical protein n=1 Tax=Treponema sp. UBA3813 TaxID=1947715 RepID=UPI0026005D84|nr:hypothetical protein [Treponema sp. UBA3813]